MKAAHGMVVTMHYTLTDDSGAELDSSRGSEPLAYLHGHGNIIPGLEKALEGKVAGHSARVSVDPKEGYGEIDAEAIFEVPRDRFPPEMNPAVGEQVYSDGPQGRMTFRIVRLTESGIVLDANHPLAGKTLHFDVELVSIRPASQEEMGHGHVHGPGGHHHG